MSWSSGKDSALALHRLRVVGDLDVSKLLVTVNADAERVAMHAVRLTLLQAQADRLGVRLHLVAIPASCPNDVYEAHMAAAMSAARDDHIECVAFGDLFLEDVRAYRETAFNGSDITPVFPLWAEPTDTLAREMIDVGIRAVVTCVDPRVLPADLAGRDFDQTFLADLPVGVDPCGERGEFHTFVWDSPDFAAPIDIQRGDIVRRDGFVFCDLKAR